MGLSTTPVYIPNDATPVSMAAANQVTDSPTNDAESVGNYCTQNPVFQGDYTSDVTLSNGGLTVSVTHDGSNAAHSLGTFPLSSGKWYFEVSPTTLAGTHELYFGLMDASHIIKSSNTGSTVFRVIRTIDGDKATTGNGGGTISTYGAGIDVGDTAKVAIDIDAGDIWFGKNTGDTWANGSGSFNQAFGSATAAFTDLDTAANAWLPVYFAVNNGSTNIADLNYGQKSFSYTPPTGYKALNTANLTTPTVTTSSDYYNAVTYTLTGSATQTISPGFGPDFVLIKRYAVSGDSGQHWCLLDSVRGTPYLSPNGTGDDDWDGGTSPVASTGSWGTSSLALQSGGKFATDAAGDYIAYCMKAGGSASTTSPAGTIASSTSVAAHGGFSIGTYAGSSSGTASTIGHGLSRKPAWRVVKNRDNSAQQWTIWQENLYDEGSDKYMSGWGNTNGMTNGAAFNSVEPTSTLFTVGNNTATNAGADYVFYAFAKTPGLIASGMYIGNGSANGPYIVVDDGGSGFKPAFLLLKKYENASGTSGSYVATRWMVIDKERDTYNPTKYELWLDDTHVQQEGSRPIDLTSNGFKLRAADGAYNEDGGKFIYLAFAESPFALNNRAR